MKDKQTIFLTTLFVIILFSTYLFGYRVLLLAFVNLIAGYATEAVFFKKKPQKDNHITAILYTLILPPMFPFHLSIFGIVFGVFFAKCVYGGYGFNIFNPALVARVFLHVSFNKELTTVWTRPLVTGWGGFATYIGQQTTVITSATPLLNYRWSGQTTLLSKLFFGLTEGSIGETSAFLILIVGIVLLIKKIISKEIVLGILASYFLISYVAIYLLEMNVQEPLYAVFSGGFLFGVFLMATDPVTSPKTKIGKYLYAVLIAFITFSLRTFAVFPGGMMFAILSANMLTPIMDVYLTKYLIRGEV
ncbi:MULTISPECIES: RnfABCDGE type electron transport complex subunit D [unclassified Fusibacter]|uniref:RnfABCDGE type electron transport complex subunit D n=1 Tax=unclassified Fusibacter TaxID=2624464 RepID=UPI0013E946B2|nr:MULTISPECIES: RnfABCDGE type electron transport complex subunit D [unclassified Fusibacter]MCK8060332.1 RnfABCDGE type electron transport complex subunit D [Fusibacter sp. A2]NPE20379.1 RnfABCDGE type electron transport complex subunit D [Fusibacter sp. A1]